MEGAEQQRAATPLGRASSGGSLASYGSLEAPPRTSVLLLAKGGLRPGTAGQPAAGGAAGARPMTSSKAAGYSSLSRAGSGASGAGSPTAKQTPTGLATVATAAAAAREQCQGVEECVHALLEEAAARIQAGDTSGAVDAAKDAARREQRLCGLLEQAGLVDQISLDLKFAVSLGLAAAYEANTQLADALAVLNQVIKSRLFPQVCGRPPLLSLQGTVKEQGARPPAMLTANSSSCSGVPRTLTAPPHIRCPPCRPAGYGSTWAPSTSSSRTMHRPSSSSAWH